MTIIVVAIVIAHNETEEKDMFNSSIKISFYHVSDKVYNIYIKRTRKGKIYYGYDDGNNKTVRATIDEIRNKDQPTIKFLDYLLSSVIDDINDDIKLKLKLLDSDIKKFLNVDTKIYVTIKTDSHTRKIQYGWDKPETKIANKSLKFFKVAENAPFSEYRKRYLQWAKKYHPDNGGFVEKMQIINYHFEEVKKYFNQ